MKVGNATHGDRWCILETVDGNGEYSCFARDYNLYCPFATKDGLETYDCRSGRGIKATHSSVAPDANNLQTFPFSAVCCRKCSDHDPTCHDICGAYQTERDVAIREQAKREERERVLKALAEFEQNLLCLNTTCCKQMFREKLQSMLGEQP